MGCCINYFIGFNNESILEKALIFTVREATRFGFQIVRFEIKPDRKTLIINPHRDCETLVLDFRKLKDKVADGEHFFWRDGCCFKEIEKSVRGDRNNPGNWCNSPFVSKELWFCSDFTKTEYAPKSVHAKVCELLRMMSPVASLICVRDEANFYETRSRKNLLENHGYLAGDRVNDLQSEAGQDG